MRIVINDIAASSGGALSVLKDFYDAVKEGDTNNEYIFFLSDTYVEETERIKVKLFPNVKNHRIYKLLFDLLLGRYQVNKWKPDIVLSLQNIIVFGTKAPQVVYIHQPLPYQKEKNFSFLKKEERSLAVYQKIIGRIINRSARKAVKVIVQTMWMKEAVSSIAKIPINKIEVIMPNTFKIKKQVLDDSERDKIETIIADSSKIEDSTEIENWNNKLFFYPTADILYKNIECIRLACHILNESGRDDFKVELTIQGSDTMNIKHISKISREEVLAKYSRSTLIFPSYIETFGLPLAEAKEAGTVILASDCAFSREILAGYVNAYFFDHKRPEELAELIKQVIDGAIVKKYVQADKDLREENNRKYGDARNSWGKVIDLLLAIQLESGR
ncbi:glycosyltransferase [Lachnospiraceae bacterium ZAX-1]